MSFRVKYDINGEVFIEDYSSRTRALEKAKEAKEKGGEIHSVTVIGNN